MRDAIPYPFPTALRSDTNAELTRLGVLDDNARFVIRRMIATAYAAGFQDGHIQGGDDERSDRSALEKGAL